MVLSDPYELLIYPTQYHKFTLKHFRVLMFFSSIMHTKNSLSSYILYIS